MAARLHRPSWVQPLSSSREFLQIPYSQVVVAALLPAAVYYIVLFIYVDQYAKANGLLGLSRAELPRVGQVLRSGWYMLLPLGLLIYLLFWRGFSARASRPCTACLP